MNKKKITALILAFAIGTSLFMSKNYLIGTTNSVYAATVNQNLSALTCIDTPSNNNTLNNSFLVAGWALNKSGIKQVQILVDGQFKSNANIGGARPDVAKVFPAYGQSNSGYYYTIDFNSIGEGRHTVTVKAIGNDGTTNSSSVGINVNKPVPLICIDTAHSGDTTLNQTTLAGWSLNASKVSSVDILVDGTKVGNAALGIARPDVARVFPAYNDGTSGFTYTLDTSKLSHIAHVITIRSNGFDGSSASQNIVLNRPRNLTTIDTPKGAITNKTTRIAGWALNPSGIKQVNILVDGNQVGSAVLGDSRSDVAMVFPEYQNGASGYHYDLDTTALIGGNHTITVQVIGNDGTIDQNNVGVNLDKPVPIMCLDTIKNGTTVLNSVQVNGWALNVSGLKEVDISVDGTKVGTATIDVSRPDVSKALPSYNQGNSGFNYTLDTSKLVEGSHNITITAIGNDSTTSTQNISINRPSAMTDIDVPHGFLVGNTANVAGWALNPSGVKEIDIIVDGTQVGTATIGDSRTDVAKVFPQYENGNSGYHYTLDISNLSGGNHTLTVQAIGNDGILRANSVTFSRPSDLLCIDSPQQGQTVDNSVNVGGWALDIRGIKEIDVLVDNQQVGTANIGVSRLDVSKAYPSYGQSDSGFNYTLDTSKLADGSHTLTIKSIGNTGTITYVNKTIYKGQQLTINQSLTDQVNARLNENKNTAFYNQFHADAVNLALGKASLYDVNNGIVAKYNNIESTNSPTSPYLYSIGSTKYSLRQEFINSCTINSTDINTIIATAQNNGVLNTNWIDSHVAKDQIYCESFIVYNAKTNTNQFVRIYAQMSITQ